MIGNIIPSNQWEQVKLGKFSASQIKDLFTEPKLKSDKEAGNLSDTAIKYLNQKAAEIITGTFRSLETWATDWGNKYESEAIEVLKDTYSDLIYYGKDNPVFFLYSDLSGGSPDALQTYTDELEENTFANLFEIKCPENPAVHVEYCGIKNGSDLKEVNKAYWYQIQFNIACIAKQLDIPVENITGIFVSYCPVVNDPFKKIHIVKIQADLEFHESVEGVVAKSENKLKQILKSLKNE